MKRIQRESWVAAMVLVLAASALSGQTAKKAPTSPTADKTDLNPMIAAQAKARSRALKAKKEPPIPEKDLVDLNGASKEALKQLPGITDAYADKIIAGRPYRTKAHLVTHDVLPFAVYDAIKRHIIARQGKP